MNPKEDRCVFFSTGPGPGSHLVLTFSPPRGSVPEHAKVLTTGLGADPTGQTPAVRPTPAFRRIRHRTRARGCPALSSWNRGGSC